MATEEPTPDAKPALGGGFTYEVRGPRALNDSERAALAAFAVTERIAALPLTEPAARALDMLGEGVGIVEASGEIVWMNQGLSRQSPETMRRFADACTVSIGAWRRSKAVTATLRASFRSNGRWYEAVMTPMRTAAAGDAEINASVALLVDATAARRVQDRLDAIDQAGVELLQFDADTVRSMNAAERLRMLEGRVVAATRSVLGFDHFEYRITEPRTSQLELVFCSGMVPLGIGERIYARAEGNGICGLVAATGESMLCADVAHEPRYLHGLPGAASALTVPLRLMTAWSACSTPRAPSAATSMTRTGSAPSSSDAMSRSRSTSSTCWWPSAARPTAPSRATSAARPRAPSRRSRSTRAACSSRRRIRRPPRWRSA
ncbi:MAG: hypothetical protein ACKOYN_03870 [Planctomycetota bacterium]